MRATLRRYERELRALAAKFGGTVEFRNSGHMCIRLPKGEQVFTSATPSDFRAIRKIEMTLRHMSDRPDRKRECAE